jgi:hypothetical protein
MLKRNIIYLLWLFIAILTLFSCGDVADPLEGDEYDGIEISEIISNIEFVKLRDDVQQDVVSEYKVGDIMAFRFRVDRIKYPISLKKTIARIMSHKTGDVLKHITFEYNWWENSPVWLEPPILLSYIGYISPVKCDYWSDKIEPDLTKKKLKIYPKGDILTVQIKYKNQIISKSITVKGD